MYNRELVLAILTRIHQAAETIMQRFKPVSNVNDFTDSPEGAEKLDSICMLLIAIGEALKNLDKVTKQSLLPRYPQVDWKKAKGMRDIISHHYFETDAEAIFDVCETKIATLADTIRIIIEDINNGDSP